MTCGVTTYNYAAPELLNSDGEPWSGTESYGFGVDVWSFGCIYFELVEKEAFVPDFTLHGSRHCVEWRLGPMPADAGLWPAGPRGTAGPAGLRELGAHGTVADHPWIAGSLRWLEKQRRGARGLLHLTAESPAVESDLVSINDPSSASDPRAITGSPAAPMPCEGRSGSTPSILSTRDDDPAPRQDPRPCKCAGHCYQPGHRSRGGCSTQSVVSGTMYCADCLCIVPRCCRPRLRGPLCFFHGKIAAGLSETMRLVKRVGHVLPELMPFTCMLPGIAERSAKTNDVGCLVVAAMLQNPRLVDHFVDLQFAQDDVSDEELLARMRGRCKDAMAEAAATEASLGRSGATVSGSHQNARHAYRVSGM